MNKFLILVFFFFTLSACNPTTKVSKSSLAKSYQGLDLYGSTKKCTEKPNLICDTSFGPGDQFALDCMAQGKKAIKCDCHDYICVEAEVRSGVDINGNPRSCSPVSKDIICTTQYTQDDQFADDCHDAGFESVQCGCHDYICIK
ncbi:MAG: hypothetical protein LW878_02795 [Proteobacteria bacterium]|nr:hypothetical protein [Pseudomonadota bacterium]